MDDDPNHGEDEDGNHQSHPSHQVKKITDVAPKSTTITRKKMCTTVPISRVNAIMRSCPNLTTVKNDAVALISKATDLIRNVYHHSENKSRLTYDNLADYIESSEYDFLKEIIPQRITVREYLMLQNNSFESNNNNGLDQLSSSDVGVDSERNGNEDYDEEQEEDSG
ncbi:Chromatin accessibility complex protein 1 [Sarcoptes scabiei]|nr:Chromatin accessibility complex protein 1 [Sarcoptes scabiei]